MINKKLLKPINKSGYGEIVGTTTHDTLLNRDKAEQHPISAITDLQTTLDAKQAKLTAGAGIDITGDTISSSGGTTNGVTLDTDQTITGIKTFSKSIPIEYNDEKFYIETTASGVLRIQTPNSFQLYLDRDTSFAFYKGFVDCLNSKITQVGDPTNEKDATTKKYVDDGLALKADKLVVPINASIDTSTTINDRVVKVVYKEYTSTGDSVVASTSAGFGYLNVSIIRKKSDNSWGIVYNDEFNEVYINSSNQIRFNIKTLAGYTNEIKLTIQHN